MQIYDGILWCLIFQDENDSRRCTNILTTTTATIQVRVYVCKYALYITNIVS